MKAIKLSRKLKKACKKAVLKGRHPDWKTSEVRICGVMGWGDVWMKYPHRNIKQFRDRTGTKIVTAFLLGQPFYS